ncbi:MAG: hypothetical protein D6800_08985 [Candidatus Zixiibacteriota bacterium]|nr:MAG: hypothetical protein D6800_08985 [candidate division Zixibacteria bacterium]
MNRWPTRLVLFLIMLPAVRLCAETTVNRSDFIYHFTDPAYVREADAALTEARRQLAELLGRTLSYRPEVYVVEHQAVFDSLIGGSMPDWGAGVALPYRHTIVVKSPRVFRVNRSLGELLAHEYAHLALHDRLGLGRPPRWLDEGMAMMVSREWTWWDDLALNRTAVFGHLLSLSDIEHVNRFSQSQAQLAYSEAYLAVAYLYKEYGKPSMQRLLDSLAAGRSLDKALMGAIGSDTKEFEQEFASYLRGRFNLVMLFADTMYFWFALAILVVIGGFLRYKRRRRYYQKWQAEEQFQSTDFDYGDPDNPEQIDDDEPWRG